MGDAESHDLPDVRVDVDGTRVTEVSTGAAFAVDPGKHVVRFEQPPWAPSPCR